MTIKDNEEPMTSRISRGLFPTIVLAALNLLACAGSSADQDDLHGTRGMPTFEQFRRATIQTPNGVYVVDGQPVRDDLELRSIYNSRFGVHTAALTVNTVNGVDDVWDDNQKSNLTYCIDKDGFGTHYPLLVESLKAAAAPWQSAADVKFVHVDSLDSSCDVSQGTVFRIDSVQPGSTILQAVAFPPSFEPSRRVLWINLSLMEDPEGTAWSSPLVDVLTHEFGHILGLRHEHTREESGTCRESGTWRALTAYDMYSVMHYPSCRGSSSKRMEFTELDAAGIAALYGPAKPPVEEPPVEEPPVEEPPVEEPPVEEPPVEEPPVEEPPVQEPPSEALD